MKISDSQVIYKFTKIRLITSHTVRTTDNKLRNGPGIASMSFLATPFEMAL